MVVSLADQAGSHQPGCLPTRSGPPVTAEVLSVITVPVATVGSARRHAAVVRDFEACA